MKITRRAAIFSAASLALPTAKADAAGRVAFHYAAVFDDAKVDWYTRFQYVVTGCILPPEQSRKLLNRGCRLLGYEWSSGFYPGDPASAEPQWEAMVRSHPEWLLNSQPVGGGSAMPGKAAFWYDYGNSSLVFGRAAHIADRLKANDYSGVFLDTPGSEYLSHEIQRAFNQRHPGVDYDRAQATFFAQLRQHLRSKIIFLNQGYRHAEQFLPYADYDLTESYFTAALGDRTGFRPLHDPAAPWESILTPMEQLVLPAKRRFPRVRYVHLGYAAGTAQQIRRAIRYNYAAAKLWNHDAYLMASDFRTEQDSVYFTELGKPLSGAYSINAQKTVAWREFEGGTVAINSGTQTASILSGRYELPDPPNGFVFRR